jgi:protein-L-isoaspartate(D-aspartate) O-methyltransferase
MKTKIIISLAMVLTLLFWKQGWVSPQEQEFSQQRENMVREQIEARGIKDKRLLEAMRKVKRHLFVPLMHRLWAYEDGPLPIGEGQTISQPYIVALMTELLALKGNEKVLEIGTGSGYQAAILAKLAKEVYTIEILEPLAKRAEGFLKELGYRNIQVKCGDGFLGWPEHAPFDAIIVTCAPEEILPPLIEQLAEGGRLVIPTGTHWQELRLVQKIEGKIVITNIIPIRFVPMLRDEKGTTKNEGKDVITVCGFWRKNIFDWMFFRVLHLFGIVYVSLLAIMGKYCPLTIWENTLAAKYDPNLIYPGSFMVHYAQKLVYPELNPLIIQIPTTIIAVSTVVIFIIKPPQNLKRIFKIKFK